MKNNLEISHRGGGEVETGTVFSRRIRQLCMERGITVGKLCSMAGTTASTIHDIVNGVTANPRVFTLKKLCVMVKLKHWG